MDNYQGELYAIEKKINNTNKDISLLNEQLQNIKIEFDNFKLKNEVNALTEANLNFETKNFSYNLHIS